MILILSIDQDESTNEVMRWLHYYNKKVVRINEYDTISISKLTSNTIEIKLKGGKIVNFSDVSAFWYRRGNYYFEKSLFQNSLLSEKVLKETTDFVCTEEKTVLEYLHNFKHRKSIGNYYTSKLNKLKTLGIAADVGLMVPPYLVTNCSKEIKTFLREHGNIITKVISDPINLYELECWFPMYTEEIKEENIGGDDPIGVTFVQKKIEKKVELRVFYLKNEFYSMAIFSQLDTQTRTDFRRYNKKNPNRTVPFDLPSKEKDKLQDLMVRLNLDSGSIDLIIDPHDNFYFLEVNPIGQFGMTSYPCNYYLERKIAKYFSE